MGAEAEAEVEAEGAVDLNLDDRKDPTAETAKIAGRLLGGLQHLPDAWREAVAVSEGHGRALLPHPLRGTFSAGEYRWGITERDANGKRLRGASQVRIAIKGKPRAFFEALALKPSWSMVDGRWFAVLDLEHAETVAVGLTTAGQAAFAAALRLCLPVWTARSEAEQREQKRKKDAAYQARRREARALKIKLGDLDRVRELAAAVVRLGASERRRDPDHLFAVRKAVGRLLVAEIDIEGGANRAKVEGGAYRVWKEKGDEWIGVWTGKGKPTWHRGSALPAPTYRDYGSKTHLVWKIRYALEISRLLEKENLDLASAIRLCICYEQPETYHADLESMASAKAPDEIPNHGLSEKVSAIVDAIPFPGGREPRPHQEVAIAYATLANYRALIGDDMGLGKTIEAIGVLNHGWRKLLPAVVVCPASVVTNWRDEIKTWAPWFSPEIVETGDPPPADERTIYVCSWDQLAKHVESFQFRGVNCVILDESHFAKNARAQRSRAAAQLAQSTPGVLLLSGTAMENTSAELWHQLHMIDPHEFPDLADFRARYAQLSQRTARGRTFVDGEGGENLEELGYRLRGYMVRRLKSDVLTDLPDKTRRLIWTHLPRTKAANGQSPADLYKLAEARIFAWVAAKHRARQLALAGKAFVHFMTEATGQSSGWTGSHRDAIRASLIRACATADKAPPSAKVAQMAIVKMGELRGLTGQAKVPAALQWIRDFRESTAGKESLVVFCEHRAVLTKICEGLMDERLGIGAKWAAISGKTSKTKRGEAVRAFQAGTVDVIVCTSAAQTGITLTRASNVLFVERWWVPAKEEQAEDRCHRMGQKNAVFIHYLMARGTVDEQIARLVDAKRQLVASVLGANTVEEEETEESLEGAASATLAQDLVRRIVGKLDTKGDQGASLSPGRLVKYLRENQLIG